MDRLGAPDQGVRSSPTWPLGRVGVEIELTLGRRGQLRLGTGER
jgi:hypothetical protein